MIFANSSGMDIYSTRNDGKPIIINIYIRTLNNQIYKYLTITGKTYIVLHKIALFHTMMTLAIVQQNILLM